MLAGHVGKLIKVAGGVRNTHSQYGDGRMEYLEILTREVLKDRESFTGSLLEKEKGNGFLHKSAMPIPQRRQWDI